MANDGTVNVIISDGAISNIRTANAELQKTYDMMLDINEAGRKGVDNLQKLKAQEKQIKLQKTIIQLEQKLEAARQKGNSSTKKTADLYTKLNGRLIKYNKELKGLLLKKELNGKLDSKEIKRVKSLEANIGRLGAAYKKVDQQLGKTEGTSRRVKRSFDSLGFSVAQLTRESPAFLISMNTGFMALSNNIPIFVDEIQRAAAANADLAKEGKKGVPVWKRLAKAVFGWQSLLSAGIVILTMYGGKIVEMISEAIKGKEVLDLLADAQEDINKTTGESVGEFKALIAVIDSATKSEKDKLGAMQELKSSYPDFNAKILDEKTAQVEVNDAIEDYIEKLGRKAKAQAALSILQEKYTELITQEQEVAEATENLEEVNNRKRKQTGNMYSQIAQQGAQRINAEKKLSTAQEKQSKIQESINDLLAIYVDNSSFSTKKTKDAAKARTWLNQTVAESIGWYEEMIAYNQKLMKESTDPFLNQKLQEEINTYMEAIKFLTPITLDDFIDFDSFTEIPVDDIVDDLDLMKKGVVNYANALGFDGENVLGTFEENHEVTIENIIELYKHLEKQAKEAESYRENLEMQRLESYSNMVTGMMDIGDVFFQDEIDKIDKLVEAHEEKYDKLYDLAEGDARQTELLNNQEEKERKKLEKKREKAERNAFLFRQAAALAEIGVQTALAIVKAKAATAAFPPPVGPALFATELGIILTNSAIQSAVVIAQAIPKFAEGGTMDHDGLALVGDGGRQEVVRNPDGSIFLTPNRDTIVPLQKGAEIYKSIDTFANEMPSDTMNRATLMTSLKLNEKAITSALMSERELDKQLLDAMINNTKAIKKQKLTSVNNSQRIDIADDLYKMKYNS